MATIDEVQFKKKMYRSPFKTELDYTMTECQSSR